MQVLGSTYLYYLITFKPFKNALQTVVLLIEARLTTANALMRILH